METEQNVSVTTKIATTPTMTTATTNYAAVVARKKNTNNATINDNNDSHVDKTSININHNSKDVKLFMSKHPIASRIRKRVEKLIVHDAAQELLEIRSKVRTTTTVDGFDNITEMTDNMHQQHGNFDIEWIVDLYHAIGYTCVTRNDVLNQASIIERSRTEVRSGDLTTPRQHQRKRLRDNHRIELQENDNYYDRKERELIDEENAVGNNEQHEIVEKSMKTHAHEAPPSVETKNRNTINKTLLKKKTTKNKTQKVDPIASKQLKSVPSSSSSTLRGVSDETNHTDDVPVVFESDLTNLMTQGAEPLEWPTAEEEQATKIRRKGGRPFGSKNGIRLTTKFKIKKDAATLKAEKFMSDLITKAAERMIVEQLKAKSQNKRCVPQGTLNRIVEQVEMEEGVPPNTINPETVKSRIEKQNITGIANLPILSPIESELLKYTVQLAKIGQPLDQKQVVSVAQTLIKKHNMSTQIIDYRKKHKWAVHESVDNTEQAAPPVLGLTWYTNFMRRQQDSILAESKVAMRYVSRYFHLRIEHFQNMYDSVYDRLVNAKVAEKLVRSIMYDIDGNRVELNERERCYGLPTHYRMIKPEYFLHVDQLGYCDKNVHDKNQNYYNHVDGQSFVVNVEDQLGEVIDMKFAVYCFCDANGTVVLCAIIFMTNKRVDELPLSVRYGIDVTKPLRHSGSSTCTSTGTSPTEAELFHWNNGPGEAMQGGPTGRFCGANTNTCVPCYVDTSSTGLLTSDVILRICTYLDELQLYDRSNGTKPCLLLDGHGCLFETSLLDYIQSETTEWMICCGLHKDTHLLNLTNSNDFNKSFREEFYIAKERLLSSRGGYHHQHGSQQYRTNNNRLYSSDIIPLINEAWNTSTIGTPNSCQKGLSIRGWNPMNYSLLLHPIVILRENAPKGKQVRVHQF